MRTIFKNVIILILLTILWISCGPRQSEKLYKEALAKEHEAGMEKALPLYKNIVEEYSDSKEATQAREKIISYKKEQQALEEKTEKESKKKFTGLLIDAMGLNLKPVIAPSIINEKNEKIYGLGVMNISNSNFPPIYVPGNIEHAKKVKELGSFPLVVKAIKSTNRGDIIISNEDAQRLYLIRHILELKKIVILVGP